MGVKYRSAMASAVSEHTWSVNEALDRSEISVLNISKNSQVALLRRVICRVRSPVFFEFSSPRCTTHQCFWPAARSPALVEMVLVSPPASWRSSMSASGQSPLLGQAGSTEHTKTPYTKSADLSTFECLERISQPFMRFCRYRMQHCSDTMHSNLFVCHLRRPERENC